MTKETARQKARELVAKMTAEEKLSQLLYNAPAIERLGIEEYNWWNESSHGIHGAGTATVFPHAIAMASTFDAELVGTVADAVSTEGRAKYNEHIKYGDHDIFKGITFWAPNINIFRDPRWGRGQETFGEDPFLTSMLAVSYINGIQGNGEFLKATACSKHFAVHSGPEKTRHGFNSVVDKHDLFETYLPAFEKTVKGGVSGVMGAYNRLNGEPCCAHSYLISQILRKEWNFDGYVVSDCGALKDIYKFHKFVETRAEAAAVALKSTCDLNCGDTYEALVDAYEQDLITDEDITAAAENLFTIRYRLGEFENPRPYSDIGYDKLDCDEHKTLNLKTAEQCMVLLKNKDNFLPLDKNINKKIAVVGPNSLSVTALEGNYNGYASEYVTVADGIRRVFKNAEVKVEKGCNYCDEYINHWSGFRNMISDGVAAAAESDITILALGLDRTVEGEDTGFDDDYTASGDKRSLFLPATQQKLAEAVCDVCDNVIVVLLCGSSIDIGEKVRSHAKAVIQAWYPGSLGGLALANILSGEVNPSAKLPVTIYKGDHNIPDFEDYNMQGRTYRYIDGDALYPFGFGLSYTKYAYENAKLISADSEKITVSAEVENIGRFKGKEIIQVYASYTDSRIATPHWQLCSVKPVTLEAGEKADVAFDIDRYWIKAVTTDGERVDPDGKITLYIGGHQPDNVSNRLLGYQCLELGIMSKI
ncbi:MAG: glycoside hydrolase family 3 C-terminal domain-containing protein [Clostridia bacterium]|nr:glycoside hydrolase family 3 C-terminal domain-containing protein [Clostridia bacterium]